MHIFCKYFNGQKGAYIAYICPMSRVRRWRSWTCLPTTSSSTCCDLPMHPVCSSLRWTFFGCENTFTFLFRKTRTRSRLRRRGRASTSSPLTPWTAAPTSTASSPSAPSSPSSSLSQLFLLWSLFDSPPGSLTMVRWLLEMAFSQVEKKGNYWEKLVFGFGFYCRILKPVRSRPLSNQYKTKSTKNLRSPDRGRGVRPLRQRHHDRPLRRPRGQRLHARPLYR